jgi:hypothetical protein
MKNHLPEEIVTYTKKFKLHTLGNSHFYYHVEHYKYSTLMKRDRFVLSVICLTPIKVSNFKDISAIQFFAIREFMDNNKHLDLNKDNSIFYGIFELSKGFRFTMDINMYKDSFVSKTESEEKLNTMLGQIIGVLPQKIYKPLVIIDPIRSKFKLGEDYAVVRSYNAAWNMLDKFDGVLTDQRKIEF